MYCAFTNNALRPVSGCTRTTGWCCTRSASSLVCTVMPANVSWTPCIFVEYAFTALCTPTRPSSIRCIPLDSVAYARYWLAHSVSPPNGGISSACRIDANGGSGRNEKSECHKLPNV